MIVRLKGVKKVRSKGKTYYYHRKTMTRLPGGPGTAPFLSALQSLNTGRRSGIASGTLGALVASYRAGPEFAALAPATRATYQKVFDGLKPLDGMPLAQITTEWLYQLRDKKHRERKRAFTNMMLVVLRLVFAWGKKRQHCKTNPALDVDLIRKPRNAPVKNRPWTPEELAVVMAEASPKLRVPLALAAYTGLRIGDVLLAQWAWYTGTAIVTTTHKTATPIWVPILRPLKDILDAAPRTHARIVIGAKGQPLTRSAVSVEFYRLTTRLRAEGRIGDGLSFHGLRHTLGTAIIAAGGSRAQAKAILGHETDRSSEHYSRHVDRRRLATEAMALLENQTENRTVTD